MITSSRNQSIKLQRNQLTSFFVSLRLEYLSVICQYNFFCIDYKKVDRVYVVYLLLILGTNLLSGKTILQQTLKP